MARFETSLCKRENTPVLVGACMYTGIITFVSLVTSYFTHLTSTIVWTARTDHLTCLPRNIWRQCPTPLSLPLLHQWKACAHENNESVDEVEPGEGQ